VTTGFAPLRYPAELRELLGVPFSDEQLAAIAAAPTALAVVAGAGSGKTTVIAARVVWLVASGAARPGEVLGLTFTNKAAAELARRVRDALLRAGLLPDRGEVIGKDEEDPGEPNISTYHAYAAELIREHGLRLGVEPGARLLTDAARYQLATRVIRAAPGPMRALTKSVARLAPDLLALEAECSEHLVDLDELRAFDADLIERLSSDARATSPASALGKALLAARRRAELTGLVQAYRAAKRRGDLIDFGDQMAVAALLAQTCPAVAAAQRERHRVVVLDEYQDTSVAQRRMLVELFGAGHPVTAVGDPCQAIYGWRGASVANLEEFPEHFAAAAPDGTTVPAQRLTLCQNRRNAPPLLALANGLAAPLRELHAGVAPLTPAAPATERAEIRTALLPTWSEELTWVCDQVESTLAAGTPAGEIAVLVRAARDIGPLHTELIRRQIPVEVVGLGGLVHLPEIADLIATLEVLDSPTADAALIRLLVGPRWRIGSRDLALLGKRAAQLVSQPSRRREALGSRAEVRIVDPVEQPALADAVASPGELGYSLQARGRFAALDAELRSLRAHLGEPLLELLHTILARTGLDVELAVESPGRRTRRRHSVEAFLDVAAEFTDLDGGTSVAAFLAYLQAAAEHERGLDSAEPEAGQAVQLMTAHKAKGLEWDVVVLPDLCDGVFPSTRGRSRWTTAGHCLPYPLRGDRASLPELGEWSPKGMGTFDAAVREQAALEELRLAYVAMTRPRHRLIAAGHWWGPTQRRPRGPSDFLSAAHEFTLSTGRDPGGPWSSAPGPGAENPCRGGGAEHSWPAPVDAAEVARRRDGAELVRVALREPAAFDGAPAADGLSETERQRVAAWDHDLSLLLRPRVRTARSRDAALPTTLTVSQFSLMATRPDALARDLARPMPRPPRPAAVRGSRFHAWLAARFGQQMLMAEEDVPGAADTEWCSDAELAELQDAFERGEFADRTPLRVEAPFALPLSGGLIRGRIDAVYATATGYEVVDWKTGGGPDADPLQLALYRLAWAEIAGVPPEAVTGAFHFVRSGRTTRPDLPSRSALVAVLECVRPGHLTVSERGERTGVAVPARSVGHRRTDARR
jgi:DNA helicase-2/ATP-dependent DNA helicase PcrA